MGLDAHALHLLNHSRKTRGPFGRTATLGRQAVHLGPREFSRLFGSTSVPGEVYCEELLVREFGASTVDSIDNSSYEGASIIADMNQPLPDALNEAYDTVIDLGCLEHIFDVEQSFRNVRNLCKLNGRILHLLPANGFCGHGFYQFSPELMFSYYSASNGFVNTEVYFADLWNTKHWYRIDPPRNGQRITIRSSHEVYLVVATQKVSPEALEVQQSDYIHAWSESDESKRVSQRFGLLSGFRETALQHPVLAQILRAMDIARSQRLPRRLRNHPQLVRVDAGTP